MAKKKHTPAADIPQDSLPIPGYEGLYTINRDGQVYHLRLGHLIKSVPLPVGYFRVNLIKDGKIKTGYIHRLLMLTFFPRENSNDLDVNHIDGNKANNSLSNLEWCTHQENIIHARRVLKAWANSPTRRKHSQSDIQRVLDLKNSGMTYQAIADMLGKTRCIIKYIAWRSRNPHAK